jgi:hypothetical protein
MENEKSEKIAGLENSINEQTNGKHIKHLTTCSKILFSELQMY